MLALVVAACGGDDDDTDDATATTAVAPSETSAGSDGTTTEPASDDPLAPQPLEERTTVQAAVAVPVIFNSTLLLADALGEFDAENLDVEIQTLQPADALALLQTGRLDVYPLGFFAGLLNAKAGGADIAVLAGFPPAPEDSRSGLWIRSDLVDDPENVDPCALEGLTLGVGGNIGSAASVIIADALARCDLGLDDIEQSPLIAADLIVAMENGSVDGGILTDPFWQQVEASGVGAFVGGQPTDMPFAGYIFGSIRNDDPEVTKAVLRALMRTNRDYLSGDYRAPGPARDALLEVLQVDDATLDTGPLFEFDPEMGVDGAAIERLQEIWFEAGVLDYEEPLDPDEVIDNTLREEILAGS